MQKETSLHYCAVTIAWCCCLFFTSTTSIASDSEVAYKTTYHADDLPDRFQRYRVGRCVLYTDLHPHLAYYIANSADQTVMALESLFRLFINDRRPIRRTPGTINRPDLVLFVYNDFKDFQEYLSSTGNTVGTSTLGLARRRNNSVETHAWMGTRSVHSFRETLQHEIMHFVEMTYDFGGWQIAISEGIAELFGYRLNVDGRLYEQGRIALKPLLKLRRMIEENDYVACEDLLFLNQVAFHETMDGHADVYTQAWSLVHFLAYAYNSRYHGRFLNFLLLCETGIDNHVAWSKAFSTLDVRGLTNLWKQYWVSVKLSPVHAAPDYIGILLDSVSSLKISKDKCTVPLLLKAAETKFDEHSLRAVGLETEIQSISETEAIILLKATDNNRQMRSDERIVRIHVLADHDNLPVLTIQNRLIYNLRGFFTVRNDVVIGHYEITHRR